MNTTDSNTAVATANPPATVTPKSNKGKGKGSQAKSNGSKPANKADEKPMLNPVLKTAMVPIIKGELARADFELVQPVEGLTLVKPAGDIGVTSPALAKFPLAYSPHTGRITGKLMNIAQFCRAQTGKAWNERHRDKIKEEEGKTLVILKDETERAQLSKALDEMRPKFYATLKGEAAAFISRADAEVQRASFRQTARGIVFNSTAVIPFAKDNEVALLRQKLAKQEEFIASLQAHVPAKTLANVRKKLKNQQKPVDINTIIEQQAAESAEAVNRLTKAADVDKAGAVETPPAATVQ